MDKQMLTSIISDQVVFNPTHQAQDDIRRNHNIFHAANREKLPVLILAQDIEKNLWHIAMAISVCNSGKVWYTPSLIFTIRYLYDSPQNTKTLNNL